MKDLDFDELDRAVNSVLSDTEKAPETNYIEAQPEPASSTPDASSEPRVTQAVDNSSVPAIHSTSLPVAVKPALPATRRSGRFMDVVHPSSDMKNAKMTAPPVPKAMTFTPFVQEADDVQSAYPSVDYALDLPTAQLSEVIEPQHLTSPFLPDAKVEKRPLGGSPVDTLSTDTIEPIAFSLDPRVESEEGTGIDSSEIEIAVEDDKQLTPDVEKSIPLLPVELGSDLLTVEAEDSMMADELTFDTKAASIPTFETEKHLEAASPVSPAGEKVTSPAMVIGSIPQQYTEQSSTGDTSHAPIYDTGDIHEPLSHPAIKKSGWLWVVWITLILALGAGIGAAAFYMGLF